MLRTLSKIHGLLVMAFHNFLSPPVAKRPIQDDPYAHLYRFLLVKISDIPYRKDLGEQEGYTLLFDE